MNHTQRNIVAGYQVAMRKEILALNRWHESTDYFLQHLDRMAILARNCREKIELEEYQQKLEV